MVDIIVKLTDTQNKCLEYAAVSVQDWADNAIHNRARIAQDEIIGALITHCNTKEIAMAVGVDAQVAQAFELGVVKTAAAANEEAEKAMRNAVEEGK